MHSLQFLLMLLLLLIFKTFCMILSRLNIILSMILSRLLMFVFIVSIFSSHWLNMVLTVGFCRFFLFLEYTFSLEMAWLIGCYYKIFSNGSINTYSCWALNLRAPHCLKKNIKRALLAVFSLHRFYHYMFNINIWAYRKQ